MGPPDIGDQIMESDREKQRSGLVLVSVVSMSAVPDSLSPRTMVKRGPPAPTPLHLLLLPAQVDSQEPKDGRPFRWEIKTNDVAGTRQAPQVPGASVLLQNRRDMSSADQHNGQIDFHAQAAHSETSGPKSWSERGEKGQRESIKRKLGWRCFCLLLRATLVSSGSDGGASGPRQYGNMIAFFSSRGDRIIAPLSFQGRSGEA